MPKNPGSPIAPKIPRPMSAKELEAERKQNPAVRPQPIDEKGNIIRTTVTKVEGGEKTYREIADVNIWSNIMNLLLVLTAGAVIIGSEPDSKNLPTPTGTEQTTTTQDKEVAEIALKLSTNKYKDSLIFSPEFDRLLYCKLYNEWINEHRDVLAELWKFVEEAKSNNSLPLASAQKITEIVDFTLKTKRDFRAQGITTVEGIASFKIPSEERTILNKIRDFLSEQKGPTQRCENAFTYTFEVLGRNKLVAEIPKAIVNLTEAIKILIEEKLKSSSREEKIKAVDMSRKLLMLMDKLATIKK